MNRDEAWLWVQSELTNDRLLKHVLAVEAIMRELAAYLNKDTEKWGMAGLIHDIDLGQTADKPETHALIAADWLIQRNFEPDIIYAVKAHCDKVQPQSILDWSLYCADPISGLIVAATLMHPGKSLNGIDTVYLMNRYREKRFASGANRQAIAACEKLGLPLESFFDLALTGMRKIGGQLGLP